MTATSTTTYIHQRGIHCESACQARILAASGHQIDEDVIFGLDGSFGFSFWPVKGNAPDVIVGKQSIMPLRATRLLGVDVTMHTPKTSSGLAKLVDTHGPVMARVDLGLLPYWGMSGRSSFGGYFVNVVAASDAGVDISDAACDTVMTVDPQQLEEARSSRNSPPLNPDSKVYVFGAPHRMPNLKVVGPVAVRNMCRDVLKPGSRSLGIPGIKQLVKISPSWASSKVGVVEDVNLTGNVVQISALSRQLLHLGRQIESFGTGGGLFRPMMGRFLHAVADHTGDGRYREAGDQMLEAGRQWSTLGQALLAESITDDPEPLLDMIADIAWPAMDLESRALSGLTTL